VNQKAGLQLVVESYASERKPEGRATEGWTEGCSAEGFLLVESYSSERKAQIKIFTSMARCWGSRKPIEFFFINTNLKL
jgi:hypothetical protein